LRFVKVAAVFIEPIQSDGGVIVPPTGFLKALEKRCKANDILVVVDEVKDPIKEISIEEAKKYRPDVKLGDEILVDITPENLEFSRIAVQAAAQTIKQNIKRLERERFFEKFKDKQGELLKAKVLKTIGDNNVILDID
jgi:N utilization substance protein A